MAKNKREKYPYTLWDLRRFYEFKLELKEMSAVNSPTLMGERDIQIGNLKQEITNIDFYLSELIRLNDKRSTDYSRYTKMTEDKERDTIDALLKELEESQ